jgi:hypothetical protein
MDYLGVKRMSMAKIIEDADIANPILSVHAAYKVFDCEVRRLMDGMSGEEFIARWESGEFDDIADQAGSRHIMRLILMMPGGDHRSG